MKVHASTADIVAILGFCFLVDAQAQGTLRTVTFDGPPTIQGSHDVGGRQYLEQGMTFAAIGPMPNQPPYHLGRTGVALPRFGGQRVWKHVSQGCTHSLAVTATRGRVLPE